MNAAQIAALDLPARHRPIAWIKADAAPRAFAACFRCHHGTDHGIERLCAHPELRDAMGGMQAVSVTRAWGGGCGPDAFKHAEPPQEG
jgi:hypothetical protein